MRNCCTSIPETYPLYRDNTFDIMKCIGIFAMIIGHFSAVGIQFIFSWHMPLFFIIAGYYYHKKEVETMILRDAKRLLLPYAVTCLAIICYYLIFSVYKNHDFVSKWLIASCYGNGSARHTSKYLSQVPVIGAIWFLWALFWCKNIFNLIMKKNSIKYLLNICLLMSIIAILVDNYLVNLPLAILPGISAVFFYALGWKIHENGGFMSINKWVVVGCLIIWIISFVFFNMSMVRCYYEIYPLNVLGACGGTYVIWKISHLISTFEDWWLVRFAIWVGKNSITFLCIHLFDLDVPIRSILHVPSLLYIPYTILLCAVGTLVMSKISFLKKIYRINGLGTE